MFELLISLFQINHSCMADSRKLPVRYGFWLLPAAVKKINGLAFGLTNAPGYFRQTINGISIELIGAGYITPFLWLGLEVETYLHKSQHMLTNNGIIAGSSIFSGRVNGVSLSLFIGSCYYLSGISLSCINACIYEAEGILAGCINLTDEMKGIQIGFFNKTYKKSAGFQLGLYNVAGLYQGIQIGLWNRNEKRALPFINWSFSRK
jgi:hypothetical protein